MSLPLTIRAAAELERRKRVFQRTYVHDPVAFVHDCFRWRDGQGPTPYQEEILSHLVESKRVAARGPHGLGKTASAAWSLLWFSLTRDGMDWKAPTTASAWRQLTKFLWPEIKKWARVLDWEKIARGPFNERTELQTLSLKLRTGEAFAVASDNAELIEGAHADSILYIFDEAKAIPDDTFDAAEGAFSGTGEVMALAISTPGAPTGRFYDIHKRKPGYEDWWVRHVTIDEAISAGRVSREWVEQRKRQWGVDSSIFKNRVLGEFAASEEEGVIPLSWVEEANERWFEWRDSGSRGDITAIGVDVARSGEDKTVLALRSGNVITELRRTSREDTMQTTGRVAGLLRQHQLAYAVVDVIGIGAGVVDRLYEQFPDRVYAFNAASGAVDMTDETHTWKFKNMRSWSWWRLRDLLNPANGYNIALPQDDKLIGDLTAPQYKILSGGVVHVEGKDSIKRRIGRSTDDADAVIMAFYEPFDSTPLILW